MERPLSLGLIGSSLSYSKSPEIQAAGLKHLQVEGDYKAVEIIPEDFTKEIIQTLKDFEGVNITIPYKEDILKFVNKKDALVERIQATNTLVINSLGIQAYNTDYFGFTKSLEKHDLADSCVAVLGAGGASKAVIIALEDMGVDKIEIYARNPGKVENSLPKVSKASLELKLYTPEEDLSHCDLLINSTPVGQGRLSKSMPVTEEQIKNLKDSTIVYDLIYSQTMFLDKAKKRSLKTYDGSKMLILQAAKSLGIWTNSEVSDELIEVMSNAYYAAA